MEKPCAGSAPAWRKPFITIPSLTRRPGQITLGSAAFADGGTIPARYTEDGEKLSPPLKWSGVPEAARSVVLVIEDADSPTPSPIVHALVLDLPPGDGELAEAALKSPGGNGTGHTLGKNTFFKSAYLPPDPPPGGGPHRYVFQVYALDQPTDLPEASGRGAVKAAMQGARSGQGRLHRYLRAALSRRASGIVPTCGHFNCQLKTGPGVSAGPTRRRGPFAARPPPSPRSPSAHGGATPVPGGGSSGNRRPSPPLPTSRVILPGAP